MLDEIMRRAAREAANPYDGRFLRFIRGTMYAGIDKVMNSTVEKSQVVKRPTDLKIATEDQIRDDIYRKSKDSRVGDIGSILSMNGFDPPETMKMDEGAIRAIAEIAAEAGASQKQIESLLKSKMSGNIQSIDNGKDLQFFLDAVPKEVANLAKTIEKQLTASNIAKYIKEDDKDNTKESRQRRAEEENKLNAEYNRRNKRETGLDKALDAFAKALDPSLDIHEQHMKDGKPFGRERTSLENVLSAFSNAMGMDEIDPSLTGSALQEAINRLTKSLDDNTVAQKGGKQRQPLWRSLLMGSARVLKAIGKPLRKFVNKVVPKRAQNVLNRFAGNIAARYAARMGVNPAIASRAAMAAGPLGWVVAGSLILTSVISTVIKGLNKLAENAMKTAHRVAHYNAYLAAASAQLRVGRLQRDIEMGQHIQNAGSNAISLENRVENEWLFWEKIKTDIGLIWSSKLSEWSLLIAKLSKGLLLFQSSTLQFLEYIPIIGREATMLRELIESWVKKPKENLMEDNQIKRLNDQFAFGNGVQQPPRQPPAAPGAPPVRFGIGGPKR